MLFRSDLDTFASWKWFARSGARLPKGEIEPKPRDDEVVVFREFFYVGLRLVLEILKRFGVKFHQLTLSSFMKLSVFVWACKSQGVKVDHDAFLRTHRVHNQPRNVVDEDEL